LQKSQQNLELKLKTSVFFDTGMKVEHKLASVSKLNAHLDTHSDLVTILANHNLKIGTCYSFNENGSIQIPWNFV
jgi:hypothetical protein